LKRLIVTADDFGAAPEVNAAVETAHRDGILTAASLMVTGPALADAVARARAMPSLRVGLHLVLVEGRPLLPAPAVPTLVGTDGCFRSDMARLGATIFFSRRARAELAAEILMQFEAFRATGLPLDHCNAHKHFHLHPTIGDLIVRIGRHFGLNAARVPAEPRAPLRRAEPGVSPAPAWLTAPWARLLRRRFIAAGILTPDYVFGLRWSGAMTKERLCGLIANLPAGLSEIYLHPATSGAFAGAVPDYRYEDELAALLSEEVIAESRNPSLRLGGYCDFMTSKNSGGTLRTSENSERNRSLAP